MARPVNPKLNATKDPTILDVAWAAGIYEGEGYTTIAKSMKDGYRGQTAQVVIAQKDPEILYKLQTLYGGGIYSATVKGKWPHFRWTLCGARARKFLFQVFPLLSIRRKAQARPVLFPTKERAICS